MTFPASHSPELFDIFSPDAFEPTPSFASFACLSSSSLSPLSATTDDLFSFPSFTSIAEQLRLASSSGPSPSSSSSDSSSHESSSPSTVTSLLLPSYASPSTQEEIDFLAAFESRPIDGADDFFLDSGYTVSDLPLPSLPDAAHTLAPELLKSDSSTSHASSSTADADADADVESSTSFFNFDRCEAFDPFSLGISFDHDGYELTVEAAPVSCKVEADSTFGLGSWYDLGSVEGVRVEGKGEDNDEDCLLQGWTGEEVYIPLPTYLSHPSSHASTSTNDTYLLPTSPPPTISSIPARTPHRARSNPSLTSTSFSSPASYRRIPAKPSLPVLRESFQPIKEEHEEHFGSLFATNVAVVGGYGGESVSLGREWEGRTSANELYGGFHTLDDVFQRFSADYPHSSRPQPITPAHSAQPSSQDQHSRVQQYTPRTTARLQAHSPMPPSPPPIHTSPLSFSPSLPSSALPTIRASQPEKDDITSRRSQSLTSPPPTPVLLSAATHDTTAPKRPSKSPARPSASTTSVPAGIAMAGSIVAMSKATDAARRASLRADALDRTRSLDVTAASVLNSTPSSATRRPSQESSLPSPPPSSSPLKRKAARRPVPPLPPIPPPAAGQQVWGFVNYTFADAEELLTGVAQTGPKLGAAGKRRRDDSEDDTPRARAKKGRH